MRDDLTEIVFILDSSGSMFGLESDTIGGFNSVINQQKNVVGKAFVTTVFFNHKSQIIHDRVDIQQIKPLTAQDYTAQGSTALLDAIGDTINHIRHIHQTLRQSPDPFLASQRHRRFQFQHYRRFTYQITTRSLHFRSL